MVPWATLTPTQFRVALDRGLGRALLHLRETGVVPDEDALFAACNRCQTHDWALEGHRAPWLWLLVVAAGRARAWAGPLLAALPEATTLPDMDQRAGLALCIARMGHPGATPALRAVLSHSPDPSETVPGARELIALHVVAGLRMVGEAVGTALLAGDDRHRLGMGTWMMDAEDQLGAATVAAVLAEAATPALRAVAEAWADDPADPDGGALGPDPGPTPPAPLGPAEHQSLWARVLACADAHARGAPLPMDDAALARALARLCRQPPVAVSPLMLALDTHPCPRVRRQLSRLYAGVRDPLLRALALAGTLGHPDALRWMVANLQPGDAARIQGALGLALAAEARHDQCGVLLRLHEAWPGESWDRALLHVYDQAPSSLHREEAVIRLIDDGRAPVWLGTEAAWDAHPDVAAAARAAFGA